MKKRWVILILFAVAMAWIESATVVYLRVLVGRLQPHQPDPLPLHPFYGPNLGAIEVVREFATMVMLATGGWLAGRTPRSRFGLFLVAFGVWDILYYVFLAVMGPWPRSPLDWDILFLIPLPWWGPVWAPASIAGLMVLGGSLVALYDEPERLLWPAPRSWAFNGAGAVLALAIFMADALAALLREPQAVRSVLPTDFHHALFLLALALMSIPIADLIRQLRLHAGSHTRSGHGTRHLRPAMTTQPFTPHWQPKPPRLPRAFREAPPIDPEAWTSPPKRGEILLLNPFYPKDPHASYGKHVLTPTLALTSLAGATPEGWNVRYWDENLLQGPAPHEPFPEVVGITVHLTFARRAYELADWYRARGAKVVLGGLHVLTCPEEAQVHADAIVVGDGVALWPKVLEELRAGAAADRYEGSYLHPYRELPPPRRDILPKGSFLTTTSIIATRGCHNRCGFCYLATDGLRMPYHMLEPEQVVAQIEADGQPYFVFIDNNLGSRKDYLRRLCRALRPLNRIWSAAVTIDVTDDPSLVREMALAGCTGVFIGFESLTGENLVDARKKTPLPEDYARRIGILHDYGIQVNGSFVLGFDHDRPECFAQLIDWIESCRMENATFHILTPYPGTPFYRQMEAEGRILHRDWERYDTGHCVFRPKHMEPEELERGYAWCYQRLFSHQSIWKRRPEEASAVIPYLAMTYLYKHSNSLWEWLIRHRLVTAAWAPLVHATRWRHVRYRKRLEEKPAPAPVLRVLEPGTR